MEMYRILLYLVQLVCNELSSITHLSLISIWLLKVPVYGQDGLVLTRIRRRFHCSEDLNEYLA